MKKAFIAILFFYLIFHFIIPQIYILCFGDIHLYSDITDSGASIKVFWLNVLPILITVSLLYILPLKNFQVKPAIRSSAASELFYVSMCYTVLFVIVAGGFKGIVSGALSGSLFNYVNLFLNPLVLLMAAIFLQEKKMKVVQMILIYVVVITLSGSRSAIIGIVLVFLIGIGFYNFNKYQKGIKKLLVYASIISPVLFILATQLRESFSAVDLSVISYVMIGRVSCIELGMIPVHFMDTNSLDFSLFFEKYGMIHQLKLIVDSLVPGDLFGFDIMPNQYYRQIFFGQSESFVLENYMSINITFPVYLYLYFGYWSIILTVLFLLLYFIFLYKLKNNSYILLLFLPPLYHILIYFDWVMIFNEFFVSLLTVGTLFGYKLFRNYFVESVKSDSHVN
ncbi:hypothetical protein HQ865_06440 [Mucilaginibacter mali]|uniref:Oligosaccharide repeat unit polymerase n=1 Tax=Mucilaginibacter mali TaxID=2740462 RepID=A0A7D4QR03_9SPHI|nr:hypothetical protein [Mucilaginibacter mali]QKJ29409.1 hypothetical protein HQ865_06440 [Mucilaginibacter mali]